MHTITLHDLPGANAQPVAYTFEFPSSWAEAGPQHLLAIATAHVEAASIGIFPAAVETEGEAPAKPGGIDGTALRFALLRHLAGIPASLMQRLPGAEDLSQVVEVTEPNGPWKPKTFTRLQLLPALDWALLPPAYRETRLPAIQHHGTTWRNTGDGFDHMTLHQWTWAATIHANLRVAPPQQQNTLLDQLLACLYTPSATAQKAHSSPLPRRGAGGEGPTGAGGEPWSNHRIETHAALLTSLPLHIKLAACLDYEAIHTTLPAKYKRVWDPGDGAARSPAGLFAIAFDVAKSGVFGTKDRVENIPLHEVLLYMEHNLHRDEQAAERNKAATS